MICEISQAFYFDAAHTLERLIDTQSSRRVHGHTYNAEVFVTGTVGSDDGMVLDLGLVRQAIEQVRDQLDHHLLNEVPGLGTPTLENLCQFIFKHLQAHLPGLSAVRVWRVSMGDSCYFRPTRG